MALPSIAAAQTSGNPQQSPDMQAGGLAPPPSIDGTTPPPPPSDTERQLAEADKEDSGRGLEFVWLDGEIGIQHLGLQTFKANHLIDAQVVKTKQSGPVYGGGLGVRLLFLTAGARFRLGNFSDWQLWTLDAEVGFRIPIGRLEPYFDFAGGYASMGQFSSANVSASAYDKAGVSVKGFDARIGGGLDWYLSNVVSIGGKASGDLMFLSRSKVAASNLTGSGGTLAANVYGADGSSIGGGLTLTAVVGLHF